MGKKQKRKNEVKIDGSKIAEKLTNNDIKVTIEKVENEK